MKKILILTASDGMNLKIANEISQIGNDNHIETEIIQLTKYNLPLYTSKEQEEKGIPSSIPQLKQTISESLGLIVVAPEYNGLIPPVLNNAIAWISVSGKDWRESFNGKTVALATHSGGGGQYVLMAMRQQFSYIGANVIGRQILTNYNKPLNPESAISVLKEVTKLGMVN